MQNEPQIFKGFDIKYPEYSITTPQSKIEYTIRSLTVGEEETLKASYLSAVQNVEHLNNILWKCIVKKPKDIDDFDKFLQKTTVRDRDALMYALYHITYKDVHEYDITCGNCNKSYPIKVSFEKVVTLKFWPDDEEPVFQKEVVVPLQSENVTAIIKQPTLWEEKKVLEESKYLKDEVRDKNIDLLIVNRFEIADPRGTESNPNVQQVTSRSDISFGYGQLLALDRKKIEDAYLETFSKYGIELKAKTTCMHCSIEEVVDLDLVRQFFRAIYE